MVSVGSISSMCKYGACELPSRSRGWCRAHYSRWYKHGEEGLGTSEVKSGIRRKQAEIRLREGYKVCSLCKLEKPLPDYYRSNSSRDDHESVCKVCKKARDWETKKGRRDSAPEKYREMHNLNNAKHYRSHPEARRRQDLKKYDLNPEQYDLLLAHQGGVCAICGTNTPGGSGKYFVVDHDHNTLRIRGLLCHRCNLGIGQFRDNVKSLARAIEYLNAGGPLA